MTDEHLDFLLGRPFVEMGDSDFTSKVLMELARRQKLRDIAWLTLASAAAVVAPLLIPISTLLPPLIDGFHRLLHAQVTMVGTGILLAICNFRSVFQKI